MENGKLTSNSNLLKVLEFTVDKTLDLANANSVMGEKIEIDGLVIIPVSKMSVGFAGGGSDISDASKKKHQHPAGSGAKVSLTPITFLVIRDKEVKLININANGLSSTLEIVKSALTQIKALFKKKD